VTVGGGAFLDFPDAPLPGSEIQSAPEGTFRVRVRVRTPPYSRIVRVLAFLNGVAVVDRRVDAPLEATTDFDDTVEVPIDRDGPVVFLAVSDADLTYVRPGKPVFAFANPIWVDRDGDGAITPVGPGPVTLPADLELCR
jgi:hypothetical protein